MFDKRESMVERRGRDEDFELLFICGRKLRVGDSGLLGDNHSWRRTN